MNNQKFKEEFKLLLEKTIFPSDKKDEERSRDWNNIISYTMANVPSKLYRFRAYNDYSVDSLKNNTISLVRPDMFYDMYDSLIYVDTTKIESLIKNALSPASLLKFIEYCHEKKEVPPLFTSIFNDEICQSVLENILSMSTDNIVDGVKAISTWDITPIKEFVKRSVVLTEKLIKENPMTKIACFTEDVCSKIMWDRYADGYKGFAVEYDFSEYVFSLCAKCDKRDCLDRVHPYLFPIIYSDCRYDATEIVHYYSTLDMSQQTKSQNNIPFPDTLFWIKAFLYKDKETYAYEKEWRFMCCCENRVQENHIELTVKKPTAIYYGTYLPLEQKKKLSLIARSKGIKEYEMYVNNNTASYSLNYREIEND